MKTMNWRIKIGCLLLVGIPAFTGFPLNRWADEIVPGITAGWVGYLILTHLAIGLILSPQMWINLTAIASLIAIPVVFGGAVVSTLMLMAGWGDAGGQPAYSSHYVSLCITMLTVIPLAVGMVAAIPLHQIEKDFLSARSGVTRGQKCLLMFLRVFNHIVFFVIPGILEVVREEHLLTLSGRDPAAPRGKDGTRGPWRLLHQRMRMVLKGMVYLGVEGICTAIQYIPLWAVEISRLPDKKDAG